jgi:hypothetical protein
MPLEQGLYPDLATRLDRQEADTSAGQRRDLHAGDGVFPQSQRLVIVVKGTPRVEARHVVGSRVLKFAA